ncbi:PAS domain-containing protein [Streptomyces sp. NPDC008001]|uniref:PAS domain-containing protein n=1 Tax=Streptomyces sp. NPDC008001 TaxID=3364804 RepID=UPI0036E60C48
MSSRPSRGAARLAAILDALPDALLLVNCNGTVVNANHIALETFEVPGTGLVGRGLLSLLPDFDSRRIPGSMRLPDSDDGRTKPTRMIARRTDGSQFPVEVTSANLEDGRTPYADHQPYTGDELLMLVVRDLTGTLDTEAELARQQRQTEMILRAAAEGVVGVDTAGKIVLLNPSAAQILGYRASDLGGKELHPLIHHSRPDGTPFPYEESPVCDTLRSGRKHRVRGQVLWAKDGRAVPVDLTTAPVRDGDQLVGAVMTFTDRRPYDALAARHAQLQAVLKESLRGPLEQLRAELGTLAADPAGQLWPEANQILHHLSAGYARMTTLVDNVLAYQQLDAGEAKLERETVALDEVVAAGVEGAVELIGPGRAQFAVHAPAIEAEVDAERFAQALAHLIADVAGVDATGNAPAGGAPSGDSTIVVAAAQRGEVVRIEVRGPYAGGDPVHGPIVRGIVRAHGGVLQTHDVPGAAGGSAYVLEVPVSSKGGPVSPAATERRSAGDTMSATTVMPVPSQRARGTTEAPAGAAPASSASSAPSASPAASAASAASSAGAGTQGSSGRRARRGADGDAPGDGAAAQQPAPALQSPQSEQAPQLPQGDGTPPTGRRRAKPRTDEEPVPSAAPSDGEGVPAARSSRHGRGGTDGSGTGPGAPATGPGGDGDASGLVPPQAQGTPAGPTGRRARRDQPQQGQQAQQAEAPRTAFALPPAEADRTPESATAAAPTGRRARRALAESPERPIPGQATGEPAGPRTAFALPPAEADRPREAGAHPEPRAVASPVAPGTAPGLPGAPRKPADDESAGFPGGGAPQVPAPPFPNRNGTGRAMPGHGGEAAADAAAGTHAPRGGAAPFPGQNGPGVPGGPGVPNAAGPAGGGGTATFLGPAGPTEGTPAPAPAPFPGQNTSSGAPGGPGVPNAAGPAGGGGTAAFLGPAGPTEGTPAPAPAPFPGQNTGSSGVPPFPRPSGPAPVGPAEAQPRQGGTAAFLAPDGGPTPGGAGNAHPEHGGAAPFTGGNGPTPGAPANAPIPGRPGQPAQPGQPGQSSGNSQNGPHGPGGPGSPASAGEGGPRPEHGGGTAAFLGPAGDAQGAPAPFPGRNPSAPAHPATAPAYPGGPGAGPQPRPAAEANGPSHAPHQAPPFPGAAPAAAPGGPNGPAPSPGTGGGEAASASYGATGPREADPSGAGAPADQPEPGAPAPTGRRRARRPLAEEPGAAAAQGSSDTSGRPISVRALGQAPPFAQQPGQEPAPGGGSGRRRRLGNPAEGERAAPPQPQGQPEQTQPQPQRGNAPMAPRPPLLDAQEGRAFAIGAPDEGSEGPEPLDGPNGAVEVMNAPRPPMDDELPPEPLDNPRRLLVWPAPDPSTEAALTERGYRPVIVHSREEVDAQTAAYPAALFVDPLTGPITRTALQSLREAAVAAEVPVLVTAGLGQATREAAYGADPAVLLKALAPRDSEMHPPRVLLIEEHEPIAEALTATLERRGMQVAWAATDAEAVALATQMHPNLVVMDLMQVRRRRAGIVDWLRGNGLLKRTPLVVYTSAGIVDPTQFSRLATGETVLFLAERSTSAEVQGRIVDLLSKVGTD